MRAAERRLLLAVTRPAPPEHGVPPAVRATDWARVVARAEALGVAGHLHAYLAARPGHAGMPDAAWRRLQALYYAQGARNAALLASLRDLLAEWAAAGIPAIVLKGAALAETVYGNVAVRPMRDLDLLVRREDVTRAAVALERLGFVPDEWYRPREWYLEHLHHLVPYRRGQTVVEIHHRLLAPGIPLTAPPETLWDRSVAATVAGVPARVLAPDDQVLHLCLHLALGDGFVGGLGGVRDIAETVRHHGTAIDWGRLAGSVGDLERPVRAALEVAAGLLLAPLPADAFRALPRGDFRAGERRALLSLASRLLLRPRSDDEGLVPTWWLRSCLQHVVMTPGWAARTRRVMNETLDTMTRRGRALGFRRMAPLYGLLIHPWRALARRARRSERS